MLVCLLEQRDFQDFPHMCENLEADVRKFCFLQSVIHVDRNKIVHKWTQNGLCVEKNCEICILNGPKIDLLRL